MTLFALVRFGNDEDPNGADTVFMVRSSTLESAAHLANQFLEIGSEGAAKAGVNFAAEIGRLETPTADESVLFGPLFGHAYNRTQAPSWQLDEDGSWVPLDNSQD